jgi:hypothetical protein|tara:strand:- start:2289 stop:2984 length:696 start_codon:yes stop_codon:yes gene_type:complete
MLRISFLLTLFLTLNFSQKNIHERWDKQLKKFVSETGKVNYNSWKNSIYDVESYLEALKDHPPQEFWPKNDIMAYWINTYNGLTVQLILQNYPLKSIKDLKDPWGRKVIEIEGKSYSLGDIEHEVLRKMNEPRIHFAINCASVSCPKLLNEAFSSLKLEQQLYRLTCDFLSDKSKNQLNSKKTMLSKIFMWYVKDFGSYNDRVDFFKKYGDDTINKETSFRYLPYDWNLNE